MSENATETNIDLLLVDDNEELRADMTHFFQRRGYHVQGCGSGESALALTDRREFDVVILDMAMPGMSGLEVLERLAARGAECEVVVLTGQGTIETAVEAMKLGAREFLSKPVSLRELDRLVRKAHETRVLHRENRHLRAVLKHQQRQSQIIGESSPMQEIYRLIQRVAPSDKPILIQGDSGTGKELVARALHEASMLADKPFVVINCAALPETLLESELFGHEKGAFTGAISTKPGLFEVADHGTLFIDEIGELAGALQAKLLRVLEDGLLRRIGSVKERRVTVRLIAATNRNMAEEVRAGRFREDLYYRINVLTLQLPTLREREGDIRLLVEHFMEPDWQIEDEVLSTFENYSGRATCGNCRTPSSGPRSWPRTIGSACRTCRRRSSPGPSRPASSKSAATWTSTRSTSCTLPTPSGVSAATRPEPPEPWASDDVHFTGCWKKHGIEAGEASN